MEIRRNVKAENGASGGKRDVSKTEAKRPAFRDVIPPAKVDEGASVDEAADDTVEEAEGEAEGETEGEDRECAEE